jgi:hypothetical protein
MMKSAHLEPQLLAGYYLRQLPAEDLLDADAHVHECEDCRSKLSRVVNWSCCLGELSSEIEPMEHLSYEQLARYVENRMSEAQRAEVDRHVEVCDMCLAELADLDQFAADMDLAPEVVARRHRDENLLETTVLEQVKQRARRHVPEFLRAHPGVDRIIEEEVAEQLIRLDVIQRSDLGEVLWEAVQRRLCAHVKELLLTMQFEPVASLEQRGAIVEEVVARATESLWNIVDIEQFRMRTASGHS